MGIYRRKDSPYWWMTLERPGQRPIQCSTRVAADATSSELAKQQRDLALEVYRAKLGDLARLRHGLPLATSIGFRDQVTWYEAHVLPRHRGAERERYALTHLKAAFGDDDLLTLTTNRAREYITARLAAKAAPRTVNRELAVLKAVIASAIPRHLSVSPLAGLKPLRAEKPRKRTLTAAEESRLLEQLEPADRALYLVAVDSLMRLSNVLDLRRDDDHGVYLEVRDSKTGPYRAMVSTRMRAALDALPDTGPYYFAHRRTAKTRRDARGALRRLLKRACARCTPPIPYGRTIGGVTFHTATRATGATRMLQAGHDPRTVQAVGNWSDFRSMQEYLTTTDALKLAAVNSVGPRTPDVNEKSRQASKPQRSRKVAKGARGGRRAAS